MEMTTKFARVGSALALVLALAAVPGLARAEGDTIEGQAATRDTSSSMDQMDSAADTGAGTLDELSPAAGTEEIDEATQASIKYSLESQGYTDVGNLVREGDTIKADAMKDGQSVQVTVDAATGSVLSTN